MNNREVTAADVAHAAKQASFALAASPSKTRNSALLAIAAALRAKAGQIFKANDIDMRQAEKEGLAAPALKRLKFDEHKDDPIGQEQLRTELADGLVLSRISCPIGVVGVIFESRPDALIQIGGLCLKSGNAVLLKGGREALHTNEALFDIMNDASVATGLPDGWCGLLTTREDVSVMLKMDEDIDLIIPRGSNAFVRYIMENSSIPVLGHSDGVCHVYVDADCDAQMAARIVVDAKTQYPAACNAAEMLLVHSGQLAGALPAIAKTLTEAGVTLRADERARAALYAAGIASEAADESDWGREYLIRWIPSKRRLLSSISMVRITRTASLPATRRRPVSSLHWWIPRACIRTARRASPTAIATALARRSAFPRAKFTRAARWGWRGFALTSTFCAGTAILSAILRRGGAASRIRNSCEGGIRNDQARACAAGAAVHGASVRRHGRADGSAARGLSHL